MLATFPENSFPQSKQQLCLGTHFLPTFCVCKIGFECGRILKLNRDRMGQNSLLNLFKKKTSGQNQFLKFQLASLDVLMTNQRNCFDKWPLCLKVLPPVLLIKKHSTKYVHYFYGKQYLQFSLCYCHLVYRLCFIDPMSLQK